MSSFLLAGLLSATLAAAPAHPIDAQTERCIAKDDSTAGQIECLSKAAAAWEKELNVQYKRLLSVLEDKAAVAALKATQRKWLEFRTTENAFLSTTYNNMQGTLWPVVAISEQIEVTRVRALQFKSTADQLTPG